MRGIQSKSFGGSRHQASSVKNKNISKKEHDKVKKVKRTARVERIKERKS